MTQKQIAFSLLKWQFPW